MTTDRGISVSKTATEGAPSLEEVAARAVESYETIELPDGRTLAYNEFGDPDGVPILICHGWPSSRVMGAALEDVARTVGVRLVSPDRPGIGGSDPHRGRRLADWPADAAALLDVLDLDAVPVLGASGGGPYAAACAALIPDRVSALSLVASLAPPETRERGIRLLTSTARFLPPLARVLVWLDTRNADNPQALFDKRAAEVSAADARVWESPVGMALAHSGMVAIESGTAALVTDLGLYAHPWGFDLGDIDVPAACWHGTTDQNAPFAMGEYLAEHIPGCRFHVKDGEGHFSTAVNNADAFFEELLELADD